MVQKQNRRNSGNLQEIGKFLKLRSHLFCDTFWQISNKIGASATRAKITRCNLLQAVSPIANVNHKY